MAPRLIAAGLLFLSPVLTARPGAAAQPVGATPPRAVPVPAAGPLEAATYADIADLADGTPLVIRAQVHTIARIEDARAPGLRVGTGRFYIEARTLALIAGQPSPGETIVFLVDLPLDPRGRPPALKKRDVVVFARPAPGRPGEIALVARDALLLWTPELDLRLRAILTALFAPDAPARITGVREIVSTLGELAGASETQVFLSAVDKSAASLTIVRKPGRPPRWGASFSELVADIDAPPARDTLAWYRLACFLPRTAPADANHSETPEARAQGDTDYAFVIAALGSCPRLR